MTMRNSRAYDWHATKKEKITCEFELEDSKIGITLILVFLVIV